MEIVKFETAKLAKKKKFDGRVGNANYRKNGELWMGLGYAETMKDNISAPYQSQLQKWLREVHRIHIHITLWIDMDRCYHYKYNIFQEYYPGEEKDKTLIPFNEYLKTEDSADHHWRFNREIVLNKYVNISGSTHEQALEEGLLESLKLIPNETT